MNMRQLIVDITSGAVLAMFIVSATFWMMVLGG